MDRIGVQPEAVRCSCYLVNPVIRERHRRLDIDTFKGKRRGKREGGRDGSSLAN